MYGILSYIIYIMIGRVLKHNIISFLFFFKFSFFSSQFYIFCLLVFFFLSQLLLLTLRLVLTVSSDFNFVNGCDFVKFHKFVFLDFFYREK